MTIDLTDVAQRLDDDDYCWLPGVVSPEIIDAAMTRVSAIVATPDEATTEGIHLWHFPFGEVQLDNFLECSGVIDVAAGLLGTTDLALNNCMLWVRKSADAQSQDTAYHRDYTDNALLAGRNPRDAVGFIVYFTEVTEDDGPTRFLPRARAEGLPLWPRRPLDGVEAIRHADGHSEALCGPAGSILVQSLLGVHRASRPARDGRRVTLHIVIRRRDAHWMSWTPWPRFADGERFRRSIVHLAPRVRALLGWPEPDWAGWQEPAVQEQVRLRFPGATRP